MPVFRLASNTIEPLAQTTFAASGVKERSDLQRLLRASIGVVAPDVLVIAEEFAEWEDSKRRIDLLGVDRAANLVVIELKRDDDGHMELQAIRYAAMVSEMTFARAVEVFEAFLRRMGSKSEARAVLLDHLKWDEPHEDQFAQDCRVVLVAADFSKELTTAVIWLNKRDLDIRCVRLKPYTLGGQVIIDAQQVVPLPEAEEYQIKLRAKEQAVRHEGSDRQALRRAFWSEFLPRAAKETPRFAGRSPGEAHYIAVSAGPNGTRYVYCVWQEVSGVEFYIDRGPEFDAFNKAVFDHLYARKAEIEAAYGRALGWERLDEKRASRIYDDSVPGGIRAPRDQWAAIGEGMIGSMKRLEAALAPHLPEAVARAEAL